MITFSKFERWALALPVPWLEVPALNNLTDSDLAERWFLLSLDLTDGSEKTIASTLIKMHSLDYLELGEKEYACKSREANASHPCG
jgi:hypothetical protein